MVKYNKDEVQKTEQKHFRNDWESHLIEKYKRYHDDDGLTLRVTEVDALVKRRLQETSEEATAFQLDWFAKREELIETHYHGLQQYYRNREFFSDVRYALESSDQFTDEQALLFAHTVLVTHGHDIVREVFPNWVRTLSNKQLREAIDSSDDSK